MGESMTRRQAMGIWRDALSTSVRSQGPDLSARQMAIMLIVYSAPPPHTVRGLAASLSISKPAVTRALDTLSHLGLLKRKRDEADKRNVLVQRTITGSVFLSDFGDSIVAAAEQHFIPATA